MPGIVTRSFAQDPLKPFRNGEILPDPDFARLRASLPRITGIRPYRAGGVRLELVAEPFGNPSEPKYLIHNYGHGGAGITLSWGCASVVVDHVASVTPLIRAARRRPSVAVLGTGVIGLTVATELRRRWPHLPITIYAKDLDVRRTTSHVAAGQFEPSGIHDDYETGPQQADLFEWLKRSRAKIESIAHSGQRQRFGVAERMNYTLDLSSPGFDLAVEAGVVGAPKAGLLPFAALKAPGREYKTWLINPTILLPRLVADLKAKDAVFRKRDFGAPADVAALKETIVINCTGYGARALFGDERLEARRGHLVILDKTKAKQLYFVSGGCNSQIISYIFCRQHDIVVGGTSRHKEEAEPQPGADRAAFDLIVAKAKALFAGDIARCEALERAAI